MGFVAGLFIGALAGVATIMFMNGASKSRREHEIYMEGFIAGQNAPKSIRYLNPL